MELGNANPYRIIGGRLAACLRDRNIDSLSIPQLQAIAADQAGSQTELILPLKELVISPGFKALADKASSGSGALQRDSLLNDLSSTFSAPIIVAMGQLLDGFLGLPLDAGSRPKPLPPKPKHLASPLLGTERTSSVSRERASIFRYIFIGLISTLGLGALILYLLMPDLLRRTAMANKNKASATTALAANAFEANGKSTKLDDSNQTAFLSSGPIEVRGELFSEKSKYGAETKTPVVAVSIGGIEVGRVIGSQSPYSSAVVQLADLDPSNKYPEVLLSSFTGGAHCCNQVKVLTSDKSGENWFEAELPAFDGSSAPAQDPIGTGHYYIVAGDDRFLYRFTNYSCSISPPQIWTLDGEKFKNVSFSPDFSAFHLKQLKSIEDGFSERIKGSSDSDCVNGFLAGYVAIKALVGQLEGGWSKMLSYYYRNSDWGLSECQAGYDDKGECRGIETKYSSFPESLKAFLLRAGYIKVGSSSELST